MQLPKADRAFIIVNNMNPQLREKMIVSKYCDLAQLSQKAAQATELSKDLDKMVAEPTEELDVEALLVESTEFIREGEYS